MQINNMNPNIWAEIMNQFEKVKREAGYEPELDTIKEIESRLGFSFDELDEEIKRTASIITIEVELIHKEAKFPSFAFPSDSGFDLFSTQEISIGPFGRVAIPTGLKINFPKGFEIQVRTKSGLALNQGLMVLNSPGTVDQGYTGEIIVPLFNANPHEVKIPIGMKVAQAVLCPVINGEIINFEKVDKIGEKDRGNKGFGSTGIF